MSGAAHRARMQRECIMLETQPPPGINAWRINEQLNHWNAQIRGPADTPYAGGIFKVELRVSDRYPFEPPRVSFLTPIYHPNIDSAGIICLDTLNMPPKGSWSPGSNLCTTLASVEQLMAYPNPNDGLVAEVVSRRGARLRSCSCDLYSAATLWPCAHGPSFSLIVCLSLPPCALCVPSDEAFQ